MEGSIQLDIFIAFQFLLAIGNAKSTLIAALICSYHMVAA